MSLTPCHAFLERFVVPQHPQFDELEYTWKVECVGLHGHPGSHRTASGITWCVDETAAKHG